jgi:pimeloyl-ACP methyl ester carboxylesterase
MKPNRRTLLVPAGPATIETITEGTGPALVMLPSLGRDGYEDFDTVAALLAAGGLTVLRPQPRGIGGSTGSMLGTSLHDMAADIAAVIRAEGAGRAVILGHAFGHFVARMTAVDHPELVRGVVLAAAAARQYAPEIAATPRQEVSKNLLFVNKKKQKNFIRLHPSLPGTTGANG